MPFMPSTFRSHARPSRAEADQQSDRRRGSARARGYTTAWDKAAKSHLDRSPVCVYCAIGAWGDEPRDEPATLVDHLVPHRGDQGIFWTRADWTSSCAACHDGPKQAVERRPADLARLVEAVRASKGGVVKSLEP